VAAGCTRVLLADAVPMRPTVVAGKGVLGHTRPSPRRRHHGSPLPSRCLHQFFVGLAAVSCWSTVVSLVAARAKLSNAVSRRPITGATASSTPCAAPRGSPPPEAKICR
jgi:hypothetical protein